MILTDEEHSRLQQISNNLEIKTNWENINFLAEILLKLNDIVEKYVTQLEH